MLNMSGIIAQILYHGNGMNEFRRTSFLKQVSHELVLEQLTTTEKTEMCTLYFRNQYYLQISMQKLFNSIMPETCSFLVYSMFKYCDTTYCVKKRFCSYVHLKETLFSKYRYFFKIFVIFVVDIFGLQSIFIKKLIENIKNVLNLP